jgi:GT2 family glycosyltransferase
MNKITDPELYRQWVRRFATLSPSDRAAIKAHIASFRQRPLVSVIPLGGKVDDPAFAALSGQLYSHWELLVAAPSGGRDKRIVQLARSGPGGIGAWFNEALAHASGAFIVPLPTGLRLAEEALYEFVHGFKAAPAPLLVFADEDEIDANGQRSRPYFKSDFDRELMLGRNQVGHVAAYDTKLLRSIGEVGAGLRSEEALLYELALCASRGVTVERIQHVPSVVGHLAERAGPFDSTDGEITQLLANHLTATGERGARILRTSQGWHVVRRELPAPEPLVSVIIPTRDRPELFEVAALGVLERTDYRNVEVLIVDNGSTEPESFEAFDRLSRDPRVTILKYAGPFNYSAINNFAADRARGEILLLLNNDTDPIGANWLGDMIALAIRPEVGAVGAKLFFANGKIQHAGIVFGPSKRITHQFFEAERYDPGPGGELILQRTVSAVTAACLAIRKAVYLEVGGLDEVNLSVALNDIDLCLRLGDFGYSILYCPTAQLFHFESASRGSDVTPEKKARLDKEQAYMERTWVSFLDSDVHCTPNIEFSFGSAKLAGPPFRTVSWKVTGTRRRT